MNRIDPRLRKELERHTGLGWRQVYRRIQAKVAETHLDPHLAALALASDLRIAISKYATSEDLAALRGAPRPTPFPPLPSAQSLAANASSYPIKPPNLDLSKLHRSQLREILKRDLAELAIAVSLDPKRTAKTCMILSGSIAEALLLDTLLHRKKRAITAAAALPKKMSNILEEWDLYDMVQVAVAMKPPLIPPDLEASAHQLRKWRNLVHPGKELRETRKNRIRPTAARARSSVAFVQLIIDELYPKKPA